MKTTPLQKAVEILGGQVHLAKAIQLAHKRAGREVKVAQAHVWNWLNSNSPMPPAEHCIIIEQATAGQVTRYELRPDVFGAPEAISSEKVA